jgi:hypothetical protein
MTKDKGQVKGARDKGRHSGTRNKGQVKRQGKRDVKQKDEKKGQETRN